MGGTQSSNSAAAGEEGVLEKDLEDKLRGSGDLETLERAFSYLSASSSESSSDKQSSVPLLSLQASFALDPISVDETAHPELSKIASHVGPAISQEFFGVETQEITWAHLLQGFQKCTQTSGRNRLKLLMSVYCRAARCADCNIKSNVSQKSPCSGTSFDFPETLGRVQLQDFFWFCWLLMCYVRLPSKSSPSRLQVFLPNIEPLLSGAINTTRSNDVSERSGSEKELPVSDIFSWVLSTIPGLGDCLVQYLRAHFERVPITMDLLEEKESPTSSVDHSASEDLERIEGKHDVTHGSLEDDSLLLRPGIAWAIGLSIRDYNASAVLFRASCGLTKTPESDYPNLLYRSSIHGKGMNRFWTSVQGYRGLTLFLISAQISKESYGEDRNGHRFLIGSLIPGGFDNKESFYGASDSCLFSLDPVFQPIRSTGGKNFVYSHKHTPGVAYRPQAKPEGVGFGGTSGNERIWLNEEFTTLTVRHHAIDKTYQAGFLVPNQGYAPVVANIAVVEVWGLGGKSAEQEQVGFLKRENLFSEQRRKVDLKTMFGAWQNSPEKMMMEMISDPNAPGREER